MRSVIVASEAVSRAGRLYVQIVSEIEVDQTRVIDVDATALAPQQGTKYRAPLSASDFLIGRIFDVPGGPGIAAVIAIEPAPVTPAT